MVPVVRSVRLASGVRLEYVEQGDPAGIPVVMLHGVTDSWHSFEPVLPHLPESLRAFAVTQRGHGDADRPAGGYRTRDFATDLAGFADALRLGPAVVVGHSMGGTNVTRFAIDYPGRVRGLVLVGSFASYRANPGLAGFWQSAIAPLADPIDPGFVREFQESTLGRPLAPAFMDAVVRESLKVPSRVWRAAFAGFFEDDFAAELGKIAAPTLVLWGDRDALAPRADQDALVAGIAGARLVAYEGTGHALHWEEPRRFAGDLTRFIDGLPGRGRAAARPRAARAPAEEAGSAL
jgi:pimeloyl-ACP methyl ester carboxylesterase